MTQPPMKVSEAVFELRDEVETGTMSPVRRKQLETLLASHEALRLAGENLIAAQAHHRDLELGADQLHHAALGIEMAEEALSLAVEEASK